MQKNKTDFISFLKGTWLYSDTIFKENELSDFLIKNKNQEFSNIEVKAKRFYRSLEEGKLNKVLDKIVPDLKKDKEANRDDVSAVLWEGEKKESEKEILKQNKSLKKPVNYFAKILTNPVNHSLEHGESFNVGLGDFVNNLSLTWKYATVSIVVLFLSIGCFNLYPTKSQESIARLDLLVSYPVVKIIDFARQINLMPDLSYNDKFAQSLPSNQAVINKQLKSEYIKNINQPIKITINNNGDHVNLTEDDIRSILAKAKIESEVVVLGIDSEIKEKKSNKTIDYIKDILRKIGQKQEQLSLDLNNKLIELIVE